MDGVWREHLQLRQEERTGIDKMVCGFKKYQHVERLNMILDSGILNGRVYVFPKLDGANHCVYYDSEKEEVRCSSRNQLLSAGYDSTGFYRYCMAHPNLKELAEDYQTYRFYGEYLIPHTIRDYEPSAYGEFYVFDVFDEDTGRYLEYPDYASICDRYDVKFIEPMKVYLDGCDLDTVSALTEDNHYLMNGDGLGEGIVVKNYDYEGIKGEQIWGKVVREDFKGLSKSKNKGREITAEELAIEGTISYQWVSKTYHKFTTDAGKKWDMSLIPEYLRFATSEWWEDFSFNVMSSYKGEEKISPRALLKEVKSQIINITLSIVGLEESE